MSISLSDINTFGDVAAEEDAVLDYFLSTNVVEKISKNEAFLVLGRKGTGKTALVRHFTERTKTYDSKALNLRNYPWAVHSKRVDYGSSDIEAYVASWRYLIAVELASLVLSHPRSSTTSKSENLHKFLVENYGGQSPSLENILRPTKLKLGKASFSPSIMGNQIGGIELERKKNDYQLGLELNVLSNAIIDDVIEVARKLNIGRLTLHFDELDQGLSRLDENRSRMLIGLILASRETRRDCAKLNFDILSVVYLRSDLWDDLQFSDKNKISQSLALQIKWDTDELQKLVDIRIKAKLGDTASWDSIADQNLMRGSQTKWNNILSRTFLRLRDVIQFLNSSLSQAKRRESDVVQFINQDIVGSRDEYSNYLKNELDDEITPHWPQWEESLQTISTIGLQYFEKTEFIEEYDRRKSNDNELSAMEALSQLYRFSVIGYERRSGYGGSRWTFQYIDPAAGWDSAASRFRVHSGLKEYLKVRETRSS